MLTAIAALLITSIIGGVFGSVATYTYMDSSEGKYCDRMSDGVQSDEEFYETYGDDSETEEDISENDSSDTGESEEE